MILKILFCFVGAIFLLMFTGYMSKKATPEPPRDPQYDHAILAVLAVKKAQRNPDSFVLESVVVTDKAACLMWRGQNGFGGMSRGRSAIARDHSYALNDLDNGFAKTWNRDCARAQSAGRDLTAQMERQLRRNAHLFR